MPDKPNYDQVNMRVGPGSESEREMMRAYAGRAHPIPYTPPPNRLTAIMIMLQVVADVAKKSLTDKETDDFVAKALAGLQGSEHCVSFDSIGVDGLKLHYGTNHLGMPYSFWLNPGGMPRQLFLDIENAAANAFEVAEYRFYRYGEGDYVE